VRYSCSVLAALLMLGGGAAVAQHGPPPAGGNPTTGSMTGQIGTMSQGDVQGLADFVDSTRRLERKDLQSKSTAIKRSKVMLDALHIACELTDAEQVGSGKTTVGGQSVDIGLYETTCSNGMGYLLTLVGKASASGVSCFAASATQPGDTSDPAKVDTKCHLPADQDINAMATTVMRNAGTACDARGAKWLGQGGAPALDYTEVACHEGEGFVLRSPAPGSIGVAIDVLSCSDAAKHGAQCQLSAPAVAATSAPAASGGATPPEGPRPDLQWFKDALSRHGVSCDVKKARVVGRESIKRRYIVEYQCPQQPQGLVAYVPSPGDTAGVFESIDCAAAAERKLACQFVGAR
jgi:hypothetical protein